MSTFIKKQYHKKNGAANVSGWPLRVARSES